jgi:hypothetical protein
MPGILLAVCLIAVAACDEQGPTGPGVPVDQEFTLAPSQAASIEGTDIRVQFVEVTGDSRCPADAVCIQGGDANVHVRVFDDGASSDYELHTGDASRAAAVHRQFRITLVQLQPYPFSSRPIDPADYRATLRVTRA